MIEQAVGRKNELRDERGPYYDVTLKRNYKKQDGSWASSNRFRDNELLVVQKVADQAHTFVMGLRANGCK